MRGRQKTVIADVREMDLLDSETARVASIAPLLARIARRPGLWRRRMSSKSEIEAEQQDFLPEAA